MPSSTARSNRPKVPLTEVQQVIYDLLEERGIVRAVDMVTHLELLDVTVDSKTVKRWCADNAGKPGPLRLAGVRSCRKGYYIARKYDAEFNTSSKTPGAPA